MFTKATIDGREDVSAYLGDLSSLCQERYSGFQRARLSAKPQDGQHNLAQAHGGIKVQEQMEHGIPTSSTTC